MLAHGFRSISLPFRGAFHLSLTVLVHYRSSRVFSLALWSGQLPTGFPVSRGTQVQVRSLPPFAYRTFTVYGPPSQAVRLANWFLTPRPCCPGSKYAPRHRRRNAGRLDTPLGLGCSPFARRYSGNRGCFLFLGVLRCFTSPRWLPQDYVFISRRTGYEPCRVSPFGNLRVSVYLRLSAAYRSLSRPSSPSDAKASTMCS